jgi:hypothetical protein
VRLIYSGAVMDMPATGATGSRRTPPTDGPENRRRRARYMPSASNREAGSSSSNTNASSSSRPHSFTSQPPARPSFAENQGPVQLTPLRPERSNEGSRPRPFSAVHSQGDSYSTSAPHQNQSRVSSEVQFGFLQTRAHHGYSMSGTMPPAASGATVSETGPSSNAVFSSAAPALQAPQFSMPSNTRVSQGSNEDVVMADANTGVVSESRSNSGNNL